MPVHDNRYRPVDNYSQHHFNTYLTIDNVYTVFFSHMDNGFSSGGESHDFHELVYVDHGAILTEIDDGEETKTLLLEQGTGYLHAPGQYHRHYVEGNMRGALCILSFQCGDPILRTVEKQPIPFTRRLKEYLSATMHYASYLFKGVQDTHPKFIFFRAENCDKLMEQMFQNNLELLFLEMLSSSRRESDNGELWGDPAADDMVEQVQDYLKQNIYGHVTIQDICSHFAYSKTTLSNKFKAATGNSIIQYFNHLKVEEAMDLMENSGETITTIAEKLNFSSAQYFSRVFKQVVGVYPRDFKKSITQKVNAKYLQQLSTHNEKSNKYFHMLNMEPEQ